MAILPYVLTPVITFIRPSPIFQML